MKNTGIRNKDALSALYDDAETLEGDALAVLCPAYTQLQAIEDRYRDMSLLGEGVLKEVYQCYDRRTDRYVAFAQLRSHLEVDFYEMFVREAWLTASLKHPNIIKILDTGVHEDGRPYFTMDLKSNQTLSDLVKEGGSLEQRLEVFLKVCDAVAYAHAQMVVHLDLKPDNIQCDNFGEVLVCDWGIAKKIGAEGDRYDTQVDADRAQNTLYGYIKGTPGYMAPEQTEPNLPKGPAADIFALGGVLHFLLTGDAPFTGQNQEEVLSKTRIAYLEPLSERFSELVVPPGIEAIVVKALQCEPTDRYETVLALQADVERFTKGFSTAAEQPSIWREMALFIGRHRTKITTFLLMGGILVFAGYQLYCERSEVREQQARAVALEQQVVQIKDDYGTVLEDIDLLESELVSKLVYSSNLVLSNFFERSSPLSLLSETERNLAQALLIQSDSEEANALKTKVNAIKMNFRAVARDQQGEREGRHFNYASLFPDYAFHYTSRPTIAQLVDFIEQVDHTGTGEASSVLESILHFDYHARSDRAAYILPIMKFVEKFNDSSMTYELSDDYKQLTVICDTRITFRNHQRRASLLRYVPLEKLTIVNSDFIFSVTLNQARVQHLDLTQLNRIEMLGAITIPSLKKVTMRRGLVDPETFRSKVSSTFAYEFEVIDP